MLARKFMFISLFTIAGLAFVPLSVAQAQSVYQACPQAASPYFRSVFPYFDKSTSRLVLVDRTTNRVTNVLETGVQELTFLGWSPNCHYLMGSLGPVLDNETVVWDIPANQRAGVFAKHAEGARHTVQWDKEGQYVLVRTRYGQFLWNVATNEQLLLTDNFCGFQQVDWDSTKGQLLVIEKDTRYFQCDNKYIDQGVMVYDLKTGKPVTFYGNPGATQSTGFRLSPDKRELTISSVGGVVEITWDRDTNTVVGYKAQNVRGEDVRLSPDKRYFAIKQIYIRVYDVTKTPQRTTRRSYEPAFVLEGGDYEWSFLDSSTIEMLHRKINYVRVFDLSTGTYR